MNGNTKCHATTTAGGYHTVSKLRVPQGRLLTATAKAQLADLQRLHIRVQRGIPADVD